jgi:hypothetical protein
MSLYRNRSDEANVLKWTVRCIVVVLAILVMYHLR